MPGHDVVVIGGSAGGVEAAVQLCRSLPAELPAALFLVIHLAGNRESFLPEVLKNSSLPVSFAVDGDAIRLEHVYVAPPDYHLIISRDHMRVVRGPRYNSYRPAIDPLFHSATRSFGPRVVGVVLSGTLDDGANGLAAIQRRGGIAVVQEPETATYAEMPRSALAHTDANYRLAPADMGPLLGRLARQTVDAPMPGAEETLDAEFGNLVGDKIDMSDIGKPSVYACPDCNGVLWEVEENGGLRFHCRIGHGFSVQSLAAEHDQALEDSMWAALRALEENIQMRRHLLGHLRTNTSLSADLETRVGESERHAERLRHLLYQRYARERRNAGD
jgi:two-component system chemotaxis response regulator CheB